MGSEREGSWVELGRVEGGETVRGIIVWEKSLFSIKVKESEVEIPNVKQ